jgi:hypothetical protein
MQQMQQLQGLGQGGLQHNWGNLGGAGRRGQLGGRAAQLQAARNAKQLAALGLDPTGLKIGRKDKRYKKKRASKLEFKRVDQLWDSTIHNYKLTDTAEDEESSEYDQYLFNVRRTFDWEGKYKACHSPYPRRNVINFWLDYGCRYQEQTPEGSSQRGYGWCQRRQLG